MKKIIAIILGLFSIFLISSYNHSNALSVADFTPALDKKIAKMKTTEENLLININNELFGNKNLVKKIANQLRKRVKFPTNKILKVYEVIFLL